MKAAVLHPPRRAADVPGSSRSWPGEDRSLVRTSAAPIVPLDLLCASGTSYFGPPALPYVPGVQGVGRVVESASIPADTRVWFATSAGMAPGDGSMAELCVVDDADLVVIDSASALDDAQIAAVGLSGVAAWMALTWRAGLRPGETVVVLGATGAVGRSAVAAARHLGAGRVVAVCRRTSAETELLAAGADAVVGTDDGPLEMAELGQRIARRRRRAGSGSHRSGLRAGGHGSCHHARARRAPGEHRRDCRGRRRVLLRGAAWPFDRHPRLYEQRAEPDATCRRPDLGAGRDGREAGARAGGALPGRRVPSRLGKGGGRVGSRVVLEF